MTGKETTRTRRLRFEIFRYNPLDPDSKPHMQTYELDEAPYMSIFIALSQIREQQDPSLQFDFACRSAICGSCGMMVNGRPMLGCRTQTSDLPDVIRMHPLPVFKLVGDLSVDTGIWFRDMVESTEAWIHAKEAFDPGAQEQRMDDDVAQKLYVANVKPGFTGPAGLNRIARFAMDPRDTRDDSDWYEVISNSQGVFGCLGLMACHDVCPKELPLLEVYAYLRRKALATTFSDQGQ